jgi:hypothetical protein
MVIRPPFRQKKISLDCHGELYPVDHVGGRGEEKAPPNPIEPTSFLPILFCFLFNGFGSEGWVHVS